jgi:hypothetical protein
MQTPVICKLYPDENRITIHDANGYYYGCVEEYDGEPAIEMFGNIDAIAILSFSNIDIVMDNWNALKELQKAK